MVTPGMLLMSEGVVTAFTLFTAAIAIMVVSPAHASHTGRVVTAFTLFTAAMATMVGTPLTKFTVWGCSHRSRCSLGSWRSVNAVTTVNR